MSKLRPMPTPASVETASDGSIAVAWRDGHVSVWRPKDLRVKCPCAGCVDEWTGEVRIAAEQIPDDLTVAAINRIGNYALSFTWSDGHSTGIYAYDRLRTMCECSACQTT